MSYELKRMFFISKPFHLIKAIDSLIYATPPILEAAFFFQFGIYSIVHDPEVFGYDDLYHK